MTTSTRYEKPLKNGRVGFIVLKDDNRVRFAAAVKDCRLWTALASYNNVFPNEVDVFQVGARTDQDGVPNGSTVDPRLNGGGISRAIIQNVPCAR